MEPVNSFFKPGNQAKPFYNLPQATGQSVSPYQGSIIQTGFKKPGKIKAGIFAPREVLKTATRGAAPVLTTKPGIIVKTAPADESPSEKMTIPGGQVTNIKPYSDNERPKTVGGWALGIGIVLGGLILLRVFKK